MSSGMTMSIRKLQDRVNRRLREIHPAYRIANLRLATEGDYWFELEMAFRSEDMPKVSGLFQELLGTRQAARRRTVQAKFYLDEQTVRHLREKAARSRKSQSQIVEEAIQLALK